jgi:hypothetical protein
MAIGSDLKINKMLSGALRGFTPVMQGLAAAFTTRFNDGSRPLGERGDTVTVPYYAIEASASTDWNGSNGYVFTDAEANAAARKVTIDQRKYQPLFVTSTELNRTNYELEQDGMMRGRKLAQDVFADIMSLITSSTYGAAAHTGAAANFDYDDVIDIATACDTANWPSEPRALVISAAYLGNLKKDATLSDASAFGSASAVRDGTIGRIGGFDVVPCQFVPANSQNLVGFASYPSGILVATAPITPAAGSERVLDYQVVTDPDTGISMEYRE